MEISSTRSARGLVASLWAFAFLSYLLRTNIAVAQQEMARDLHLNNIQVGQMFTAFLIGYTVFQLPAGLLGDRFGPRIVLALSGLGWALTTFLTGFVPGAVAKGTAASLTAVLLVRFAHGLEEAATYPVAMTAVADWFPLSGHALITSIIFTGSTLGSAFAPPLVAYLMTGLGWRSTFYVTATFPLLLAAIWWWQTRNRQHRSNTGEPKRSGRSWAHLFLQKNIAFLCVSYLLYCYAISIFVYWLFKYLVDVRHLSLIGSGWATSLPWIFASAAVPVAGYISRWASERKGRLSGRRSVATSCLLAASVLMFAGAGASQTAWAVLAIALSVGLLFSTESSYWSTAIDLARSDAGAASGLMNLAGNLGGVLSTMLVPVLVEHVGWFYALLSGSAFAIAAACCWLFITSKPSSSESILYTDDFPPGPRLKTDASPSSNASST